MAKQADFDDTGSVPIALPAREDLPHSIRDRRIIGAHLVPAALFGGYIVGGEGDCLAPTVQDGDGLVLHPRAVVRRGMLVGVTFP
jgi:hypothetical protein